MYRLTLTRTNFRLRQLQPARALAMTSPESASVTAVVRDEHDQAPASDQDRMALKALVSEGLASPISEHSHEQLIEGMRKRIRNARHSSIGECRQTSFVAFADGFAGYHENNRRCVMSDLVEELAQRGLALSPEDRARLAERLLDSLRDPRLAEIEAAWDEEIERRVAAYERGEVETFAAEDVFAEARRIAP